MKIKEIAHLVGGRLIGDGKLSIKKITEIEDASNRDLVFYFGNQPSIKTRAICVITKYKLAGVKNQIITPEPRYALYRLLKHFYRDSLLEDSQTTENLIKNSKKTKTIGGGTLAYIHKSASIGKNTTLGPFVYIGKNVAIGNNVLIMPMVTILSGSKIGNDVLIQSGVVIGSQGFGYLKDKKQYRRIPHIGRVIIEDDVEIGANVTIDRGTLSDTVIGKGTKVDNLVHIGHNVKIGKNCIIIAQVGISGSVKIGNNVILAGQVGVKDKVEIGDNSIIYAKSAVFKSVPKDSLFSGIPARDHRETMKAYARLFKIAENNKNTD